MMDVDALQLQIVDFGDDTEARGLPPAPLCSVCEHPLCALCGEPWCDRMCNGQDEDSSGCCSYRCTVDPIEFEDWQQHALERMGWNEPDDGSAELVHWTGELGPYCPTWRRERRVCTMCAYQQGDEAPGASYVATGASGLEWFECPEHDELDNLADDRRVRRELLSTWFERLRALELAHGARVEVQDTLQQFVAGFWGQPPKGVQ